MHEPPRAQERDHFGLIFGWLTHRGMNMRAIHDFYTQEKVLL